MASMEPATSGTDEKHEVGLFLRICRCFTKENGSLKVTEVNGTDVGVAFFRPQGRRGHNNSSCSLLGQLFLPRITMVHVLFIELGKEYSFNVVCNYVEL